MTALYEITGNMKELLNSDFDERTISDTLESLHGEFNDKAVSIIKLVENLNGDTRAIDAEIKRLQARKQAVTNKQKHLREYLLHNMDANGITKIECPLFTASLRKGLESVEITDEALLPDEFVKAEVVTKADKKAIKDALKSGASVPGAALKRGDTTITIK